MTTTTGRPAARNGTAPAAPLRRRRPSRLLLLAVVLAVVGALLGLYAYRAATARSGVVAVARSLDSGSVVELSDLREVELPAGTGLATMPWSGVGRWSGGRSRPALCRSL